MYLQPLINLIVSMKYLILKEKLMGKIDLKRINDEITIRNSSIIKLGELSCIVEDPPNKNIFIFAQVLIIKLKRILFMKYILMINF